MLSVEQQNLVSNNIKLVYSVATKLHLLNDKDAIQEGFIGLCKAAEMYNVKKSKFSTFATNYIYGYIKMYKRKDFLIKPTNSKTYEPYTVEEYNEDTLVSPKNNLRLKEEIHDIILSSDDLMKDILTMYYMGYSQEDIGKKLGIKQCSVSRKMKEFGKELNDGQFR